MPDYSQGKIYRVFSPSLGISYIGSTCCKLNERMKAHKYMAKKQPGMCSVDSVFQNNDAKIELIEDCPCETKWELLQREGFWIERCDCVNKYLPGQDPVEKNKHKCKEYYYVNRKERLDYRKKHYEENRDQIRQKAREKIECDCGIIYSRSARARHMKSKRHQEWESRKTTSQTS